MVICKLGGDGVSSKQSTGDRSNPVAANKTRDKEVLGLEKVVHLLVIALDPGHCDGT
jgi:hypothetical protein